MNACSQKAELPVPIKKPYEMTKHGHTRIDDYYWMRLTDEQKSKKPYDDHTQQVLIYKFGKIITEDHPFPLQKNSRMIFSMRCWSH
ncbi:hypothetical protein Ct9H90mP29_14400 [bacterium]|nr:MAG: hypothetical protein Ct9H90mP29_14400 [bacterium]